MDRPFKQRKIDAPPLNVGRYVRILDCKMCCHRTYTKSS